MKDRNFNTVIFVSKYIIIFTLTTHYSKNVLNDFTLSEIKGTTYDTNHISYKLYVG